MEKKRKIDEEAEWEKAKENKKKNDVLKCLEGDLELLHAGIRVAENAVEEGNRLWWGNGKETIRYEQTEDV